MSTQYAFANNFWGKDDVGYQQLILRMHHAKLTCEELQAYYKERMNIEADYAKRLSNLAKRALGSKETGTLRRSLDVVRSTTEQMGTSHDTVARQIQEEFLAPLDSFSANIRDRRKTSEDLMARLNKAKKSQNDMVEKARAKYEQECHKVTGYKAQQNLLMGKELERNNAKLERASFNVEQLQRDYQASLNVLGQTTESWNSTWRLSCDKFQELETERIAYIKSNLWDFTNATSTACVNDDEGFEAVRVSLEHCEPTEDVIAFVKECGTGGHIMDPPEFTNYLSGFTRDSKTDSYKLARFGNEDSELNQSMNQSMNHSMDQSMDRSFNQSMAQSIDHLAGSSSAYTAQDDDNGLDMSYMSRLSMDKVPNLQPQLIVTSEEDAYGSTSPYQGSASATSSIYSNATTIESPQMKPASASPTQRQELRPQSFEPIPIEQKRRSWAKPFKRQSSPDLSKVWKALGDSQSSATFGKFSPQELDTAPYNEPMSFDDGPNSTTDRYRRTLETKVNQASGRVKVASKIAHQDDPLLAAIDQLKTPPLGSLPPQSAQRKPPRPASMPGISSLSTASSPQRKPVHTDARQAPPMNTAPTQSHTPYPESFAPQQIPTKAPGRERRYTFNDDQPYETPSFDQKRLNRRSADAYQPQAHQWYQGYQQPQQAVQAQAQAQIQQRQVKSQRPRPKSMGNVGSDNSLLPSRTSDGRPVILHARAQFDFRARIPMEVSFRKNDILLVTHMQEDGWWEAEVLTTKASGVAPGNFLQQLR